MIIEYILLGYALSILIFFGWTIKDAEQYSTKLVLSFIMLSLAWPIILIVYYLDGKEA
jgi:hypothetical protein